MSDFASALQAAISARGWSLRQAGIRLGVSASLLGMLTSGRRRAPLDRLWSWKAPLGLDAAAFEELVELALISHGCADLSRYLRTLYAASAASDGAGAGAVRRVLTRATAKLRVAEPERPR